MPITPGTGTRPLTLPSTVQLPPTAPPAVTTQPPASAATATATVATGDQVAPPPPQGSSTTSIDLVGAPPPKPPVVELASKGQRNSTIAELNELLSELELLGSANNIFSDRTEAALKKFQQSNGLEAHGKFDEATLRKLLEAAKQDDGSYPKLEATLERAEATRVANSGGAPVSTTRPEPRPRTVPTPETQEVETPQRFANDNDRVKAEVARQLAAKGINTDHAFGVGEDLVKQAEKWDRAMPSSTMCYTAVKRAIQDGMNIPYRVYGGKAHPGGGSAKTAGKYMLSKQPEFTKIEGLRRSDLDNLPAGAVIVYKPAKGHGHIGVQNGRGQDVSDKTRTQANVHRTAEFEVWFPTAVRGQTPPPPPGSQAARLQQDPTATP